MKPLLRVGMEPLTVRCVAAGEPVEAFPGQPMSLARPKQAVPPGAANLTDEFPYASTPGFPQQFRNLRAAYPKVAWTVSSRPNVPDQLALRQ